MTLHLIPARRLAAAVGGTVDDTRRDTIHVGADLIYASLNGTVRVARLGRVVHTLGMWSDPTDQLAANYRAWAGVEQVSA